MKVFLSLIILVINIPTFAQVGSGMDIEWGPSQKAPKRSYVEAIVGKADGKTFVLRDTRLGMLIEAYDMDLNQIKSANINLSYRGTSLTYEFMIRFNDRLLIFGSYQDLFEQEITLFYQEIDKELLSPIGELVLIERFYGNSTQTIEFDYRVSKAGTKLLMLNYIYNQENELDSYNMIVLDEEMNELWGKEKANIKEEGAYYHDEFILDEAGNVYEIGITYQGTKKGKRNGKPYYAYTIIAYKEQGDQILDQEVTLSDKFITDLKGTVGENGHIICTGLYADKGTYAIKGAFLLSLGLDMQQTQPAYHIEFETPLIDKLSLENRNKKQEVEYYDYDLKRVIIRNDGGAILLAEQFQLKTETTTSTNPNGGISTRSIDYYYYDDIIIAYISPDSTISKGIKIPKRQVTVNDLGRFSSFVHLVTDDKIYLLFNDNPKNLDLAQAQEPISYTGRSSAISKVTIDINKGTYSRELLSDHKDNEMIIPELSQPTSTNTKLVYSHKAKRYRVGKLKY